MTDIQKPDMSKQWANSGNKTPPADSLINSGWLAGQIPLESDFNYIDARQDQGLAYVLQKGIAEWDNSTEYQANKSYVQYGGKVYKCIQTGTNKQPDTQSAYWRDEKGILPSHTISSFISTGVEDGVLIIFSGINNPADGGGGLFRYSFSSTSTADGMNVFAPTGGGRLHRVETASVDVRGAGAVADGVADNTTAIGRVYSTGTDVELANGVYKVLNSSAFPDISNSVEPVNVVAGSKTQITGTIVPGSWGSIPCLGHTQGNTYNLIHYNYRFAKPNVAIEDPGAAGVYPFGLATDIVECVPGTSFRGNANASFQHVVGKSGVNAQIGSINMLTRLDAGFLGDGNGTEIDVDNFAANRKGLGALVTGIGDKVCEAGVKVTRGDITSPWYYGIQVQRAKYGLYVDLTDEPGAINGVFVKGLSQDLLKLTPKDDLNPSNTVLSGTNADGSVTRWKISKTGSWAGMGNVKATGDVSADTSSLGVQIGTVSTPVGESAVACIMSDAGAYGGFKHLIVQPRTSAGDAGDFIVRAGAVTPTEQFRVEAGGTVRPGTDNSQALGDAGYRWSVVYAGTGTINTSDARAKQQVRDLSDAEVAVAARCKKLLKAFKFNDAVELKGDDARIHFGVMAQDVAAAFEAEGLDANDYALFCYDEWEASPEVIDEKGTVVVPAREAGNRYGIRYDQLLAFIIAAL